MLFTLGFVLCGLPGTLYTKRGLPVFPGCPLKYTLIIDVRADAGLLHRQHLLFCDFDRH